MRSDFQHMCICTHVHWSACFKSGKQNSYTTATHMSKYMFCCDVRKLKNQNALASSVTTCNFKGAWDGTGLPVEQLVVENLKEIYWHC